MTTKGVHVEGNYYFYSTAFISYPQVSPRSVFYTDYETRCFALRVKFFTRRYNSSSFLLGYDELRCICSVQKENMIPFVRQRRCGSQCLIKLCLSTRAV